MLLSQEWKPKPWLKQLMRLFIPWLFNLLDFLSCPSPSFLLATQAFLSILKHARHTPPYSLCYIVIIVWMLFSHISASGHCITFFLKSHLCMEEFYSKVQSICPLPRSISSLVLMIFTFLPCLLLIVYPSSLSNRMYASWRQTVLSLLFMNVSNALITVPAP